MEAPETFGEPPKTEAAKGPTALEQKRSLPMSYLKQSPEKATYVSGNAAGAGQYKINRRDGKLEFSKTLFALEGERLPMALRLAYVQDLPASITTLIGGKWKFNYEQYLYAEGGGYVYIDGQGKRHEFVKFSGSTNEYYDTCFSGLVLRVSANTATIADDRTMTLTFTGGKLTRIQEKRGTTANTTTISASASSMSITDGENRICTISKSGSTVTVNKPHPSSAAASSYQIEIVRSATLCTVTDIGGEVCTYTTNADGSLDSIESSFGRKVEFTYDAAAARYTKAAEQKGAYVLRTYILTKSKQKGPALKGAFCAPWGSSSLQYHSGVLLLRLSPQFIAKCALSGCEAIASG